MSIYDLFNDIGERMAMSYKQTAMKGIKYDKSDMVLVAFIEFLDHDKKNMVRSIGQLNDLLDILKRLVVELLPQEPKYIKIDVMIIDAETLSMTTLSRHLYEHKNAKYSFLYSVNNIKFKTSDDYH